jgi:outer membrane protein OmpA-like peptidoglycan-associated protein
MRSSLRVVLLATSLAFALAAPAAASTFTVTSSAASGTGSLTSAVSQANSNPGADTIVFAPSLNGATITPDNTLTITGDVTITGLGADRLTLDGSGLSSGQATFFLNTAVTATISDLKLTHSPGSAVSASGGANVSVLRDWITNNTAVPAPVSATNSTLAVDSSTISVNTATGNIAENIAGGIAVIRSQATIHNSTITDNTATVAGSGGVAISTGNNQPGAASVTIENSTIAGNSGVTTANLQAKTEGVAGQTATATVQSSILAEVQGGQLNCDMADPGTSIISTGHNIDSTNDCGFSGTGDQVSTDPVLGPLEDNGGPTLTRAPAVGGPAIDKGSNPQSLATDQRGFARTFDIPGVTNGSGGATDVGAFEAEPITVDVTNLADTGIGSFRDALTKVTASPDTGSPDTVLFDPALSGTINSDSTLHVNGNTVVTGPGADHVTVRRSGASGSYSVITANTSGASSVSGLKLTNGSAPVGGGMRVLSSTSGTLGLDQMAFVGNSAVTGGGLAVQGATVTLTRSEVSGNSAAGGDGGGILSSSNTNVVDSTVSGNSTDQIGGGLSGSVFTVLSSTVAGNTAPAGAASNLDIGGTVTNSIVDEPLPAGNPNCDGGFSATGENISSDATCGFSISNTDPQLGPLQDNGGPTRTRAIPGSSPAVDAGNGAPSTDQRGLPSPVDLPDRANLGDGSDLGAYELQTLTNDLGLTGTKSADPVTAGSGAGNITHTYTLANAGPDDSPSVPVDLTTTLPAGVTLASVTPSAGTYDAGTHVWTVPALASGASATLTIKLTADASTADDASVASSVSLGALPAADTDPASGNNSASESTEVRRPPAADVAPGVADFGSQKVATRSATRRFTVTDSGGGLPLNVSGVSVTGADAAQFSIAAETCTAASVAAGASCTVDVAFAPTSTGGKMATLSVASDAAGSPVSVALTGTGTVGALQLSSVRLDFGKVKAGRHSTARTFAATNTGSSPVTVTAATLGGRDASQFVGSLSGCAKKTLAPGQACFVSAAFAPKSAGAKSATLSFASDAPGSPATVALTGRGVAAAVVPSSLTGIVDSPARPTAAGITAGCRLNRGSVRTCSVQAFVGSTRVGKASRTISRRGTRSATVRLPLTAALLVRLSRAAGGLPASLRYRATAFDTARRFSATRHTRILGSRLKLVPTFGNFAINSDVLTPRSRVFLRNLAHSIKTAKRVVCIGYTQAGAPRAQSLALSRKRARAACAALRASGLVAHFTPIGLGSANPRANNRTPAGAALNRRVEITILR